MRLQLQNTLSITGRSWFLEGGLFTNLRGKSAFTYLNKFFSISLLNHFILLSLQPKFGSFCYVKMRLGQSMACRDCLILAYPLMFLNRASPRSRSVLFTYTLHLYCVRSKLVCFAQYRRIKAFRSTKLFKVEIDSGIFLSLIFLAFKRGKVESLAGSVC